MKALNISDLEVMDLVIPKHWTLISINEEYENLVQVNHLPDNSLIVKFSDVNEQVKLDENRIFNPISKENAKLIIDFIERFKDNNFIVHCVAGVSRSEAVCLYIHLTYKHELKENFWSLSEPNPFVLGRLLIEKK